MPSIQNSPPSRKRLIEFIAIQALLIEQTTRAITAVQEALIECGVEPDILEDLFRLTMGDMGKFNEVMRNHFHGDDQRYYATHVINNADLDVRGKANARSIYSVVKGAGELIALRATAKAATYAKEEIEKVLAEKLKNNTS